MRVRIYARGRGLKEFVNSMHELEKLGVRLVSFKESIDLTTSNGWH